MTIFPCVWNYAYECTQFIYTSNYIKESFKVISRVKSLVKSFGHMGKIKLTSQSIYFFKWESCVKTVWQQRFLKKFCLIEDSQFDSYQLHSHIYEMSEGGLTFSQVLITKIGRASCRERVWLWVLGTWAKWNQHPSQFFFKWKSCVKIVWQLHSRYFWRSFVWLRIHSLIPINFIVIYIICQKVAWLFLKS